jgi:DNA-directed RNA polymerase III subunit RPC2
MPPKTQGTKRKSTAGASSTTTPTPSASSSLPRVKREAIDADDDEPVAEVKAEELHWGDDLFNADKLNEPIKQASDKWALVPTFLKLHGLVRQHIDSFDHFVNEEMKQIMLANNRIEVGESGFYLEYKDIWIGEPRSDDPKMPKNITPQQCRLRDMTYSAPIYVTIEYVRGRTVIVRRGLCIGRMPIMLRSSKCVLLGLNKDQLASAGECEHDPGGYFIVRGTEKVILIQEQLSKNRIIIEPDSKGCLAASCTSTGSMFKSRFQIVRERDGVLRARHINLDNVNAVVLLRALGVHSEAAVAAVVGTDLVEALGPTFAEAAQLNVSTELDALEYIGANLAGQALWRQKRSRIDEARNALLRVVLSHVPAPHHDLRGKAAFVALMMRRVLLAADDTRLVDDRDYYGNKRLELAGELLNLLFEDLFKIQNATLKKNIEKSLEKQYHTQQFDAIHLVRPDLITSGLVRAISTGNWSVKRFKMERSGVTAVLSRLSFIAALGMMTRITSQFEKTRKISGPRALQPSQFGMLCPSDTPEGESCGLVKNLALLTHVTTGDDEGPLRRVAYNLGVDPLLRAGITAMASADAYLVLLNGNVLGVTRLAQQLARSVRRMRRASLVGEFVSIHVNERERTVHLASDGGRLCRPLLVCDKNGRPVLNAGHLAALRRGELNFGDLLVGGVVEFIDVNEENDCLIAVNETALQHDTTHLEIAPYTMLGVVAGLIPYPHHNQSPRNTYQCAMGKQAMGNIAFNQQQRIDTVLYLLQYAQKPMVRTHTIELIGFNELPAGQNASIAVMSYSGYDIEDALVLNRASLDRGYGRCAVMRKQAASARRYANQTVDKFELSRETALLKDFADVDRDGIALPGSRIAPHSVLMVKKTPVGSGTATVADLNHVQYTDSVQRCDLPESVMVDQVLLTSAEDDHWLVKMLLRSTRRPELGDKFSSRHGQKGVVGHIAQSVDMPFSEAGITPDMIMNPHGFPSRMTVGKMIELVAGKAGVLHGKFKYGTAFGGDSAASCGLELIRRGYSYAGKDILTSGITGEMLPAYVFAGPVFYQKLKHMVMDKMHARSTGPRTVLTRQPTEGRSRDGGLRLGEMERDCLSTEMQVLTDRGFMFLHEIESYAGTEPPLRYASVDENDALIFELATELIVKPATPGQTLYEFTQQAEAAAWATGSDPYGRSEVRVKSSAKHHSNHVSFVVTGGHDVYCRKGRNTYWRIEGFRKFKAEELYLAAQSGDELDKLKFKGKLVGGLADGGDLPSDLVRELNLSTPARCVTFCELYGFFLGDGSLSCGYDAISFRNVKDHDIEWLLDQFATLGLEYGKDYTQTAPCGSGKEVLVNVTNEAWTRAFMAIEREDVKSANWFAWWVWRLRKELTRAVIAGLRRADGNQSADTTAIFTSSARCRDEIVRLCLQAGYAARFSSAYVSGEGRGIDRNGVPIIATKDAWTVVYHESELADPVLHFTRDITTVAYSDRTWCVSVPHGLIVVRRAHADAATGVVLKASLPVVMGNCLISYGASNLLVERLMISSDQFDVHVCRACGFMGYEGWCQYCKSAVQVTRLTVPYACKLLFQELQSMNVVPKLKLDKQ